MTELNKDKVNVIKEKLGIPDTNASGSGQSRITRAMAEPARPHSITEYVKLVRDELSHFPTHIQIRILARAAMQIADEQHRAIGKLVRGR